MDAFDIPLTTLVLGIATGILALSIFVQVLQEVWKFLTSSRARCYTAVLEDFLGPWARRMTRPGVLPEFQARGPFQLRRLGPTGVLLPMGQRELVEGLERTTSPWTRRCLRALRIEADLQGGTKKKLSGQWARFLEEIKLADSVKAASSDLRKVKDFIKEEKLDVDKTKDAASSLRLFRERFIPHVTDAERHFGRLGELFEFRWRRRNLRQTFVLGFVVAFVAALPIQELYHRAADMSEEETMAFAERTMELYKEHRELFAADTSSTDSGAQGATQPVSVSHDSLRSGAADTTLRPEHLQAALTEALLDIVQKEPLRNQFNGVAKFLADDSAFDRLLYILGCLLTALLVSFGAPFWNDVVGAIWRLKQNGDSQPSGATKKQPGDTTQ